MNATHVFIVVADTLSLVLAVYTDVDEDVDEDADEDADGGATVDDDATSAIPVKEIAQAAATSKASKEFQVKIEGKTSSSSSAKLKQKDGKTMADNNNNNNNNNDVNDDVEIVEAAAKKLTMVAESTSKKASTIGKIDDDDDVRVEGVLNETRFSHMRQHCTSFPFRPGTPNNLQIANREYCEKCYCYVCDSLAKDCKQWHSPFSSDPYQNHCCASEKNVVWEEMRSRAKVAKMRNAPNGNEKRDDGPPHGCHFSADCFDGLYVLNSGNPGNCLRCWCYICDKQVFYCDDYNHVQHHPGSDYARKERQKRKLSTFGVPGPFEPTNPDAPKDTSLTQCRRCSWFFRFDSKRSCTPSFSDWCPHCGRVASEDDLEKNQQATTSAASDTKNVVHEQQPYVVGEKEIPFRIVAHDPRLFEDFKDNWEDAGDSTSSPEWYYDEAERQEEVFLHRIGRAPKWSNVFRALPLVAEKNVPRTSSSLWKYNGVVKDSSDAVIIDDPQQYQLLCYIAKVAGTNEEADTWFKIHATWHKESKLGTFKLQFMVPKDAFLGQNNVSRHRFKHYVSGILGLWFGIFPLQVSELSGLLNPSSAEDIINEMELKCRMNRHIRNIPISIKPFEVEVIEDGILPVIRKSLESRLASLRNGKDENDSRLTLAPSDVSNINVDVSTSGRSSDPFRDSLVRYFSEQFASKIHRVDWKCLSDLVANSFGAIARAECPNFLEPVLGFESMITAEICYLKDIKAKGLFRLPPSIQRTMIQLENLGHEAEDCVEGLTIELLEFQRQSLRWALERERIPGGIQSYHWLKLPNRGEEYQDDIYYNPLLKLFRKDKPAVIRGGFIAEQMGLGKTVISLALILKNPAPEFPLSGNPISALKQNIPSGISSNIVTSDNIGWENNLYEKTSIINKQKGSTICRGTLVICPVSLVGQWIAEAKSKLKEPGLVYPYHGAKRTRDSKILAANSIVVTTYSTIASDAVYHARQSFDTNYCPPLEKIRWWRIICDEGHCLRTAGTGHSKAVLSLVADHKWIVSGTPMNTSYGDLKNQLKFLGFEHLEKTFIAMNYNITRHNKPMHDMSLITYFLRPIMMRHSHKQKYRGTSTTLMSLPPKTERKEIVKFTASEKKEFAKIEKEAQDWYLKFRSANLTKMSKHFLKISSRLIPLRVACSGGNYPVYLEDHNPEDEKDTGITDVNTDGDENIKKKTKKNTVYSKFVFTSKFKTLLAKLESIKTNEPDCKLILFVFKMVRNILSHISCSYLLLFYFAFDCQPNLLCSPSFHLPSLG